jgi:hypothetical protein
LLAERVNVPIGVVLTGPNNVDVDDRAFEAKLTYMEKSSKDL